MAKLNETHDPARKSWVESANRAGTDFPIQNLPHGVFRRSGEAFRGGVAIGDMIFDMRVAVACGLFPGDLAEAAEAAAEPTLNWFMSMGNGPAGKLRARLSDLLRADGPERAKLEAMADKLLVPMNEAEMTTPARIGAFTDFMTSTYHIASARPGRPEGQVQPCFKHLPIAYNSRASSVTVDGRPVERPNGQRREASGEVVFGPTTRLDFELEFAFFVGPGNELGRPVPLSRAEDQIFGYCLLNDWSARDMQVWESVLGPFLAKSFRTTISPWVVTHEALAPFRMPTFQRAADDPKPLPHLDDPKDKAEGGVDVALRAYIRTAKMRSAGETPALVTDTHMRHGYFTLAQMLTHHASNGCNLQPGDLLSSGTVSGPAKEGAACVWEITGGIEPIKLPNGEERLWLHDGDEVIFRGRAQADGKVSIGFGDCGAEILPSVEWPKG